MSAPVPPLAAHELMLLLLQLGTLLLLALALGRLAVRLRMPAIVGELLAGVLIGPSLLGNIAPAFSGWLLPHEPTQMHLLDAVGQFGVLLLVSIAGIELDASLVRRRSSTALRISLFGLTIPLTLGITLGLFAPDALTPDGAEQVVVALFLGVAMCVTAIPVIAKTLADLRLTHRDVGQLTLTSATVDDTVGWFLLSIVSAMATLGLSAIRVGRSLLFLAGFVLLAWLVGRPLARIALRWARQSGEAGVTMATTVVIVLFAAAASHALGMEAVFGAFVAGIVIGTCGELEHKHLAPLRTVVLGVLAPIFLATVGLRMDLSTLLDPTVALAAAAVLFIAIVGKFTGAYLGARISRVSHWESLAIGSAMNARGVIEIVVGMVGLRLGVLNAASFTIIALVAIVTSIMAPPLLRFAMARVSHSADELLRKAAHEGNWALAPATVEPSRPAEAGRG
jgi:Kef-type K+ transport system membrane component KefB